MNYQLLIPPMHQSITFKEMQLDENGNPLTDRYGKPLPSEEVTSMANVRSIQKVVRTTDGAVSLGDYEIDVPSNVSLKSGTKITFVTIQGEEKTGIVESVEEVVPITFNKVIFKVLHVNET